LLASPTAADAQELHNAAEQSGGQMTVALSDPDLGECQTFRGTRFHEVFGLLAALFFSIFAVVIGLWPRAGTPLVIRIVGFVFLGATALYFGWLGLATPSLRLTVGARGLRLTRREWPWRRSTQLIYWSEVTEVAHERSGFAVLAVRGGHKVRVRVLPDDFENFTLEHVVRARLADWQRTEGRGDPAPLPGTETTPVPLTDPDLGEAQAFRGSRIQSVSLLVPAAIFGTLEVLGLIGLPDVGTRILLAAIETPLVFGFSWLSIRTQSLRVTIGARGLRTAQRRLPWRLSRQLVYWSEVTEIKHSVFDFTVIAVHYGQKVPVSVDQQGFADYSLEDLARRRLADWQRTEPAAMAPTGAPQEPQASSGTDSN
jgi:hypothetical protein